MTYSRYLKPSGIDYDQVAVPTNPSVGEVWRERSATDSRSIILDWWWNGSVWLNAQINRRQILLPYGQGIIVGGNTGQGIATTTSDHPVEMGNLYNIYLRRVTASFNTAGTLTGSNYWRLNFKNGASAVQSLNITSGNASEATGNVSKSSADINTIYANTGRYFVNLQAVGSAPTINNPSCFLEYLLARP
jgi:hypothetical protein